VTITPGAAGGGVARLQRTVSLPSPTAGARQASTATGATGAIDRVETLVDRCYLQRGTQAPGCAINWGRRRSSCRWNSGKRRM